MISKNQKAIKMNLGLSSHSERYLKSLLVCAVLAIFGATDASADADISKLSCQPDNDDFRVKLIVHLAKGEQFDLAHAEMETLTENQMKEIITQLYNGNVSNTELVYDLITPLTVGCNAYGQGISTWFHEMKKNDHLSHPELLILSAEIARGSCPTNEKIKQVTSLIEPHEDNILNQWAMDIKSGNWDHIYSYMNASSDKDFSVRLQVSKLVKKALGINAVHYSMVIAFVKDFHYLETEARGLLAIIEELKRTNKEHSLEMVETSFWIHFHITEAYKESIYNNSHLVESFFYLKTEIPTLIHDLFWKSPCTLKNSVLNEFLENETDNMYYSSILLIRGSVANTKWKLDWYHDENKPVFFTLSVDSRENTEYLCEKTPNSTIISTCNDFIEEEIYWTLEPVADETFLVKNLAYMNSGNGYLGVTSSGNKRDIKLSTILDSSKWVISCK